MTAAHSLHDEVHLRPATPSDADFIGSSWVKSYRDHAPEMPGPIYFDGQGRLVDTLLARCSAVVACDPEHPDAVFGYVVSERRGPVVVVHYLYVKHVFRRLGIARRLLDAVGATRCHYTHQTRVGRLLARKLDAKFNPYLGVVP